MEKSKSKALIKIKVNPKMHNIKKSNVFIYYI